LEKYHLLADEAMMVGDMSIDIIAGQSAGIKTCAVTFGLHGSDILLKTDPDYMIDDFKELLRIVDGKLL